MRWGGASAPHAPPPPPPDTPLILYNNRFSCSSSKVIIRTAYQLFSEAVTQRCSVKKVCLEISQLTGKDLCQNLFFNKVAGHIDFQLFALFNAEVCFSFYIAKILCKSFLSIIFNNHTIIFLTERSEPIKLCLKGALLGLRQFLATESR